MKERREDSGTVRLTVVYPRAFLEVRRLTALIFSKDHTWFFLVRSQWTVWQILRDFGNQDSIMCYFPWVGRGARYLESDRRGCEDSTGQAADREPEQDTPFPEECVFL